MSMYEGQLLHRSGCMKTFCHRVLYSILWILTQQAIFIFLLSLVNADIFSTNAWFNPRTRVKPFSNISDWLIIVCYFIALFTICIRYGRYFINAKSVARPAFIPFSRFKNLFFKQNISFLVMFVIIGLLTSLVGMTLMAESCYIFATCSKDTETACIQERSVMQILFGPFLGLCFYTSEILCEKKPMIFFPVPLISHTQRLPIVKSAIRESVISSLWHTVYYFAAYLITGTSIKECLQYMTGFVYDDSLESVASLQDISLLMHLFVIAFCYNFMMQNLSCMFFIYMTMPLYFPITDENTPEGGQKLQFALGLDEFPLFQSLAYQDLFTISKYDITRRKEIFSVTRPGRFGHNWRSIVNQCNKLIDNYANELNEAILKFTNVPVQKSTYQIKSNVTFKDRILKMPLICMLVEYPNYLFLCYILNKGQNVVWAVLSLGALLNAVIIEDEFGVTHDDVPVIVNTLLNLKKSIKALNRTTALQPVTAKTISVHCMKNSLESALNRSLYMIIQKYSLSTLSVNAEHREQIELYVQFKE